MIAATTGFEQCSSLLKTSLRLTPSTFPPNSDMSAPAIKALPLPVTTTPTTLSSDSAFRRLSCKPVLTPSLSGFTGGLSTVKTATLSIISYKTVPFKAFLLNFYVVSALYIKKMHFIL